MDRSTLEIVFTEIESLRKGLFSKGGKGALTMLYHRLEELEDIYLSEMAYREEKRLNDHRENRRSNLNRETFKQFNKG